MAFSGLYKRVKCILVLIFLSSGAFAQIPPEINQRPDVQNEAERLQQYYEILLRNALSGYYRKGTFIINARVYLEEVLVPKSYESPRQIREPLQLQTLPGLPVLPEGLTRTVDVDTDTIRPSEYDKALQIDRMLINVLVDTSYTSDDEDFIEVLVSSVAKLDEMRGDIVEIDRRVFPRDPKNLDQPRVSETEEEPVVRRDTVYIAPQEPEEPEEPEESGLFDWENPVLLWAIIGGLILLALILMAVLLGRRRKKEEGPASSDGQMARIMDELQRIRGTEEEPEEISDEPTPEQRALYEEDCSYLTNQYISHPQTVADLLQEWITEDPDKGLLKAAKAVTGANPKLLATLRPNLDREHFDALQYTIEEMDPMSLKERMEKAREFRKSLQQRSSDGTEDDRKSDLFNFMHQLSDDQVLHLIKEESDEMVAILLAQIDGERAGKLLQRMDEERRASLLVNMGKIDSLTVPALKQIANQFSRKALEVANMKYVAADGVQSVLSLIDSLPVGEQEEYVDTIAKSDIDLAQKIKKFFVAFNDIPNVKDSVLENALEELDTETLINALTDSDPAVFNRIMVFRPKREQLLIKSEINNVTEIDKSEVERARKKLLTAIRKQKQ